MFKPIIIQPVSMRTGYRLQGTSIIPTKGRFKLNEQYDDVAWGVMTRIMNQASLVCWQGDKAPQRFHEDSRVGKIVRFSQFTNGEVGFTKGDYAEFDMGDSLSAEYVSGKWARPLGSLLVNHSKKLYINMKKWFDTVSASEEKIAHPLPILTVAGNDGVSEGTYYGTNMFLVGTWAWDLLEGNQVETEQHFLEMGYQEFDVLFRVKEVPKKVDELDYYLAHQQQVVADMAKFGLMEPGK